MPFAKGAWSSIRVTGLDKEAVATAVAALERVAAAVSPEPPSAAVAAPRRRHPAHPLPVHSSEEAKQAAQAEWAGPAQEEFAAAAPKRRIAALITAREKRTNFGSDGRCC